MNQDENMVKILYIKLIFEKTLDSVLINHDINQKDFAEENVSEEKINNLFESIYNDIGKYLLMGTLIKTGKFDEIVKSFKDKTADENDG